ncbi:winged helix-turn-helix domain-containing protein [Halegenticoccus soli]|uniref:winged helix-turn-helix domain-containing protein n=1 Tax=Halegenticoccus soli TaxID=1985678 RepID=UPI0013042698|nr:helix-turn-helix domain-containing protein [Halegenticoccus soli]
MAIPTWVWPGSATASGRPFDQTKIGDVSEAFGVLSNPIRLEILNAIYERESPISYTDLRAATSIDDNGKLNYHLRQLNRYIVNENGQYTLSEQGRRVIESLVVTEDGVFFDQ